MFIENTTQVGGNESFCRARQTIWGRGLNNKTTHGSNFFVDGGTFWLLGFKTKNKPYPSFEVRNGGRLKVLGGYANAIQNGIADTPMVLVENSRASVTMFTDNWTAFGEGVEVRGSERPTASRTSFPRRKLKVGNLLFVPLFFAGATAHDSAETPSRTPDTGPNRLTSEEKEAGFELLFNDRDFEGWKNPGGRIIEDGTFAFRERGGGLCYRAKKIPDDFELRFQ